jgi:hypothetical protein
LKEEWKQIEDFPDYEISNFGRVKSNRYSYRKPLPPGRILKQVFYKKTVPYMVVGLIRTPNKIETRFVHRLVLFAFKGKPQKNQVCNHIDGNRSNNRVSNLEWVTQKENINHAIKIGLTKVGENVYNAKLTNETVIRIKKLIKNKVNQSAIARHYRVSQTLINNIARNISWKHT